MLLFVDLALNLGTFLLHFFFLSQLFVVSAGTITAPPCQKPATSAAFRVTLVLHQNCG
jgi:hypothetical protein